MSLSPSMVTPGLNSASPGMGSYFPSITPAFHPEPRPSPSSALPPSSPVHAHVTGRPVRTPSGTRRTTPLARSVYPQSQSLSITRRTPSESGSGSDPDPLSIIVPDCLPTSPGKHSAPSPTSPTARSGSSPSKRGAYYYAMSTRSTSTSTTSSHSADGLDSPTPFPPPPLVSITSAASPLVVSPSAIYNSTTPTNHQHPFCHPPSASPSTSTSHPSASAFHFPSAMSFTLNSTLIRRTTPPAPHSSLSTSSRSTNSTTPPVSAASRPSSTFNSISPDQLIQWLLNTPDDVLVLDVRNVSAYSQVKIRDSVGFNLPTTLLKRPLYGVDRSVPHPTFGIQADSL